MDLSSLMEAFIFGYMEVLDTNFGEQMVQKLERLK
jgi:hypothetical protein